MRRGIRLRYVKPVKDARTGKVYLYYRAPGARLVRLPDLPENHPEFLRAYERAAQAAGTPASTRQAREGSIAALCAVYRASQSFLTMRASTREVRLRILGKIEEKGREALMRDLRPRHIAADLAPLSAHAANNRLKVWRALMKEAKRIGWLATDPSREVEKFRTPPGGHEPWPIGFIERFRASHAIGTDARLAFELAYWTGARRSDLARMGRQMIGQDGWLTYRQEKTGGEVSVPLFCALPGWMAPLAAEHRHVLAALKGARERMLFIAKANGAGRSIKAFGAWFGAQARAAGIPAGYTVHGLRKSRLVALAELGWSTHQLASWGGHASLKEVQHYTQAAERKRLLMGEQNKPGTVENAPTKMENGAKS